MPRMLIVYAYRTGWLFQSLVIESVVAPFDVMTESLMLQVCRSIADSKGVPRDRVVMLSFQKLDG